MAGKKKKVVVPIVAGIVVLGAISSFLPHDTDIADDILTTPSTAIIEQITDDSSDDVQNIAVKLSPEPSEPEPTPADTAPEEPEPDEPSEAPEAPKAAQGPEPEQTPEPATSIDPEQAFRDKLNQYNYVGSSESDKYHYPSCRWTSKINDANLVHFDTVEEASAAGYSPCGTCHPK